MSELREIGLELTHDDCRRMEEIAEQLPDLTPRSWRLTSKEYADAASVDYAKVDVPNARWHEQHTFTCFAFPTYSEENMRQIAAALVKVIKAFS